LPLLSERERTILLAVIERHIATAEPVSSQELCSRYGFGWSAPTVRNEMARLEELGLLNHPYTSAGKVPTVKAYRFFVDQLLDTHDPAGGQDQNDLRLEILKQVRETDRIIKLTAKVLAMATELMAISWVPSLGKARLVGIRLSRLNARKVLLELVTSNPEEYHQIFDPGEPVSNRLISRVNEIINERCRGCAARELSRLAAAEWPGLDRSLLLLVRQALMLAGAGLSLPDQGEVVLEGASNLIQQPEFDNILATRQLVAFLDHREALVHSLEAAGAERPGIRVVIGEDGPDAGLPALSFVTDGVALAGRQAWIGVIGPRRMAYNRIIPLVKQTALALAKAAVKNK
jgi:heat-inducible transcriptional repressor